MNLNNLEISKPSEEEIFQMKRKRLPEILRLKELCAQLTWTVQLKLCGKFNEFRDCKPSSKPGLTVLTLLSLHIDLAIVQSLYGKAGV